LQPKDWLGLRLTGYISTEVSDASATGLWDFTNSAWHEEFCRILPLDPSLLPPIMEGEQVRGFLQDDAADDLGLLPGVPVVLGRADTAAAQLGSGAPLVPGRTILNLGTGGQLTQILPKPANPPPSGAMSLYGPMEHSYYLMAPTHAAGLALDWLRSLWSLSWADLYDIAFSAEAMAANPLFTPFTPTMPHAGTAKPAIALANWYDLSLDHTQAQLIRACVEGCMYALCEAKDLLLSYRHAKVVETCTLVGGGARDDRVKQLVADILGIPIQCPDLLNASARGAAISACAAAGWFASAKDAGRAFSRPLSTYLPDQNVTGVHVERFKRFKALTATRSGDI
jgi:sugar (pentulose or hexulose) kinase